MQLLEGSVYPDSENFWPIYNVVAESGVSGLHCGTWVESLSLK